MASVSPTLPIYLLGGGGHARSLLAAMRQAGMAGAGIIDPSLPTGSTVAGLPVVGGDTFLGSLTAGSASIVLAVGVNRNSAVRQRLASQLQAQGLAPCTVIHPQASIDPGCTLAAGAQVFAGAILNAGAEIGSHAVINTGAIVEHDCRIDPLAFIGPGAILCGGVHIGYAALIGAGAVLLPGVAIPPRTTVPAGSVVRLSATAGLKIARPAYPETEHD